MSSKKYFCPQIATLCPYPTLLVGFRFLISYFPFCHSHTADSRKDFKIEVANKGRLKCRESNFTISNGPHNGNNFL